ncbi:MAG: Mov34/MPN/PAD-1 family protein [Anaerolineales bacterium]
MTIKLKPDVLRQIHAHGESNYPLEGAGLLIGHSAGTDREVIRLHPLANRFEADQRHYRYRLDPLELMQAEDEVDALGLEIVGIFHSHPDHPAEPSDYDLEWSLPYYSYIITSIAGGQAVESRSWRLVEDRGRFKEEAIWIENETTENG